MPKLKALHIERNQIKVENAALRLFTRQGFHGTTVREIADEAGVSLGNIYNYYDTKERLYESLVARYEARMASLQRELISPLIGAVDEDSLKRLADAVKEIVYREPDYWRLMYVDIVEFENKHFAHSFRDLARNLKALDGKHPRRGNGVRQELDGSLAYTAIYLQFFTYFLIERLFGGKRHLGLPHEQTIDQLIRIFLEGVRPRASAV